MIWRLMIVLLSAATSTAAQDLTSPPATANLWDPEFLGVQASFNVLSFSQPDRFDDIAKGVTFGAAARLGEFEGWPVFLELGLSSANATSFTTNTVTSATSGPFVLGTSVSPTGTLDLSVSTGATGATATVFVASDDGGSPVTITSTTESPPGGMTSLFAVSNTETGGVFAALTTDGSAPTASAFGAIYDESGAVFVGTGDIGETTTRHRISDNIRYTERSLYLTSRHSLGEDWTITPKIGVASQTYGFDHIDTSIVNIAEGTATASQIPTVTLQRTDVLDNELTSVTLGADMSRQIRDNLYLTVGLEVGAAKYDATARLVDSLDVAGFTSKSFSSVQASQSGDATKSGLSVGLSRIIAPRVVFSVVARFDYVSDMPYMDRVSNGSPTLSGTETDPSLTGDGEVYDSISIGTKPLMATSLSANLVFSF